MATSTVQERVIRSDFEFSIAAEFNYRNRNQTKEWLERLGN